jgi:hypothetical protein
MTASMHPELCAFLVFDKLIGTAKADVKSGLASIGAPVTAQVK